MQGLSLPWVLHFSVERALSVASFLADSPVGLKILQANNNWLACWIKANTLNQIISEGENKGLSIALLLANSPVGLEILQANNNRLACWINANTLNQIIPEGRHKGLRRFTSEVQH